MMQTTSASLCMVHNMSCYNKHSPSDSFGCHDFCIPMTESAPVALSVVESGIESTDSSYIRPNLLVYPELGQ